jgi:hypothetical protein
MKPFAAFENLDVVKILGYGVIGLGLLLATLAFRLLQKEQSKNTPEDKILKSVYMFMIFSVVLCLIGVGAQFLDQSKASNIQQEEVDKLKAEVSRLQGELKSRDDKIEMLTKEATKQVGLRELLASKLDDINVAIMEKEFNELQSLLANTDPARRERLKREIDGLRNRVSEAKQLVAAK